METTAITAALTTVVGNVTDIAGAAAPLVLGAIGTIAGINIGIKLFKKFANKAA